MKGTLPRQGTSRKPRSSGSPRPPALRPSRRPVALIAGVCLALAALIVTGATLLSNRGDTTEGRIASLDGHPVTRDELLFHMRRLAPTVQNELRNKYDLRGTVDWNAKAGDRTALQRLETRALDEIRRDKTTLVLAKEQGLVDSVDHADFLAELAKENESRARAVAAGQTVYGVTEFSPDEYYTHRLTELTTSLKKRLGADADGPLRVTDAEVRHAFDTDRDEWSANATTYEYTKLVVPVPAETATLRQRVAAARSLADVAAEEPGARLTTATYDGGGSTGLNTHDQDLLSVLGKLRTGEVSAPVTGTGQVAYYELDGKSVDEGKAFAAYSRRIRQSLVEEKFDQFLQRRVDDGDIDVDTKALGAINAEDVQQ